MSTTQFKYKLERNRPKGDCPQCGKRGVFRYYEGVPRDFGICERKNNCGYHNKPDASIKPEELPKPEPPKAQLYVDAKQVKTWITKPQSNFHNWAIANGIGLKHLQTWGVGADIKGFTIYIFKNEKGEYLNAKFMRYTEGGSRDKEYTPCSMRATKTGQYKMCLFGEHLLSKDKSKIVCIVESEKTAVIASFHYPKLDWVACGSCNGLTDEKIGVLVGRKVINLRDADDAGRTKGTIEKRLKQWNIDFQGLDLFPDKNDGYDLADAIRDGIKPTIEWQEVKGEAVSDAEENEEEDYSFLSRILPKGVDAKDTLEYGFYEYRNRYWLQRKGYDFENVSNFTMKVLFLIVGVNAKRIVEVTNVYGKKAVIDMAIGDLISVEKFKERVESIGNFQFQGKSSDLARIKSKLFNLEKPSIEISTLGQYRDLFYTFGNGVYKDGNFIDIDDKGMIELITKDENSKETKEHYYIPVFGSIQADENEDLRNYRKFIHRPTAVNFKEWSKLFCDVYGENGQITLAFSIVALFRDFIQDKRKCTPMLFLFGQRGSGKGTLANSILNLWGVPQDPLMLGGASTVVGFMRKLGQFQNAIVWLDEYKNDIDEKKIESLKNIWDGIGYERGVKDQSNKTQTSPVRSAAMLSGQEMPNREPALFSRNILLTFKTAGNRTQTEIDEFNNLREVEDNGITNCTLEILKHRQYFKDNFEKKYAEVAKLLRTAFQNTEVIERQIVNHAILNAAVWTLQDKVSFPFNVFDLMKVSEKRINEQRLMMRTANEVQQFFEMVYYLLSNNIIHDEDAIMFRADFVYIRLKEIMPFYRQHSKQQGLKALDKGTLESYLEASEAYDEDESKRSHRFKKIQNPTTARVFLQSQLTKLYSIDLKEAISKNREAAQNDDNQTVIEIK
jgi:hypothetical protein